MIAKHSRIVSILALSTFSAIATFSLKHLPGRPAPLPCESNPKLSYMVAIYGVPPGYFAVGNTAENRDIFELHAQYFEVLVPQPDVNDLIPDWGSIYRVTHEPIEGLTTGDRIGIPLERVHPEVLPDGIERGKCTFGVPLNAVARFGDDAEVWPPPMFPDDFKTHILVKAIDPRNKTPAAAATAKAEYWTEDDADKSHHKMTLEKGDTLKAGRWTFKVTNIVPPQDLPAKGSFKGGHVVGWVEFLLIEVDEERGKAGKAEPK